MCQNDSSGVVGRGGSKGLWVSSLFMETSSVTYGGKGAMTWGQDTWGFMPTLLSGPETHPLWALRLPSENRGQQELTVSCSRSYSY